MSSVHAVLLATPTVHFFTGSLASKMNPPREWLEAQHQQYFYVLLVSICHCIMRTKNTEESV